MSLPPRAFFSLTEAAARWGCTPADIAGWALAGRLEIVTGIPPVQCGSETIAGVVAVPASDILPVFRQCHPRPSRWKVRRIREIGKTDWRLITAPKKGVPIVAEDLVISAAEVARFEDDHELVRRSHAGTGPAAKYDWDAFHLAVIVHLHEHGLPETQNEFVGLMQDWFVRHSETGEAPDQSTIRKRISPIWRSLRD
jgi:hypothetical protein